jgi:hypothetical protein
MLFPMFFVPFDQYFVVAIVGVAWFAKHRHWHQNATVRRLEHLVALDRGRR